METKPIGAFNNSEKGICNQCTKKKREYKEGHFKPFKDVSQIFVGNV